jgi:hypothetical protein
MVRELAAMFRTRIELKQIGVRDEARRLSGIGRCGREYCSASWLPELRPVNLGVAKDQRLSLNPSQISGACGRLMCCLRYEHDFYVRQRKRFPKEGRVVTTTRGLEKVLSNDIFRERVTLRAEDGETRVVTLPDFRAELDGERTVEHPLEEDAVGTSMDDIPEEVIRLQDTVELPAWVPRASAPRSDALRRSLPVAPAGGEERPPRPAPGVRPSSPDDREATDTPPDSAETGASSGSTDDAVPERRRRRRGRRGGRRNRESRGGDGLNRDAADRDESDRDETKGDEGG